MIYQYMTSYRFTNKVCGIKDMIELIGDWKHHFERASDIEQLNESHKFQSLIFQIFHNEYNSGLLLRNNNTDKRLNITISKHSNKKYVFITFEAFEKYKKIPYYRDILVIKTEDTPIKSQRKIALDILNDNMLLKFFQKNSMLG